MPARRIRVGKTREIIQLRLGMGLTKQQVVQNCNRSPSTVHDCIVRVKFVGLSWPLSEELDDPKLEHRFDF